jgi:hypothetical protein
VSTVEAWSKKEKYHCLLSYEAYTAKAGKQAEKDSKLFRESRSSRSEGRTSSN